MPHQSTGQLSTSLGHFTKYRPLMRELVTRDLKIKYRRSFLGYVWSILNPLLMMLLQTLACVSYIGRRPGGGSLQRLYRGYAERRMRCL